MGNFTCIISCLVGASWSIIYFSIILTHKIKDKSISKYFALSPCNENRNLAKMLPPIYHIDDLVCHFRIILSYLALQLACQIRFVEWSSRRPRRPLMRSNGRIHQPTASPVRHLCQIGTLYQICHHLNLKRPVYWSNIPIAFLPPFKMGGLASPRFLSGFKSSSFSRPFSSSLV